MEGAPVEDKKYGRWMYDYDFDSKTKEFVKIKEAAVTQPPPSLPASLAVILLSSSGGACEWVASEMSLQGDHLLICRASDASNYLSAVERSERSSKFSEIVFTRVDDASEMVQMALQARRYVLMILGDQMPPFKDVVLRWNTDVERELVSMEGLVLCNRAGYEQLMRAPEPHLELCPQLSALLEMN